MHVQNTVNQNVHVNLLLHLCGINTLTAENEILNFYAEST